MNFKDLQPMGDFKMRLQYELERVKSVCEFDPKLNTNEIDYYNNTIPRLESVIENAIFYLKTNEIKSNLHFNEIKIHLRNLNQKLFELMAEAESKGVKISTELSDFNAVVDSLLSLDTPEYLTNYVEIEQEVRKFIKVDSEQNECTKPKMKVFDYLKISVLFATGQLPIPGKKVPEKFNFDNREFPNVAQLGKHLNKKLGVFKPENYLRDTYHQTCENKDLFTSKRAKDFKQYLEENQINIIPEFQVFLEGKINT